MMQERKHMLVATLGGQPQIVTFTLDLLLRRGIPIYEVIVVHPASSPDLQQSLERLNAEFIGDRYNFEGRKLTIHFRQQVLSRYDTIIDDIIDETTASGALDTIGEMIRDLKQQRRIIHFSISGGRRLMAFLSFSAALLYFETSDELLHLYTPESLKERIDGSGVMHLPPQDGQRLIEVPFARAAQPLLASMLNRTPSATIQTHHEQRKAEEQKYCKQVVEALKDKPRQVLRALAQGMHPNQAAAALNIKPSTISTYTNVIYQTCRNVWGLPDNVQVNYLFVQARFADYFPDEESITDPRKKEIQTSLEKNRN
ncbi:MAG: histidine kinase [Chloroflexi bacterium]|nr:histidine kinase [Chloroflexota bacterium]